MSKVYQFAYLYYYSERESLFSIHLGEDLIQETRYKGVLEFLVAKISADGWQIVGMYRGINFCVWFQREVV